MPGPIPEVVARVGGDASGYINAYKAARAETQGLIADNRELIAQAAEVTKAMQAVRGAGGAAGGDADIARTNAAIRETLASLKEVQPVMAAAQAATGDYGSVVKYLGSTHSDLAPLIRATTAAVGEQVTVTKAATDAVAEHTVVLERAADAHGSGTASVLSYVESLGMVRDTARDTTSALADTASVISAASWGSAATDAERVAGAARIIQQVGASRASHLAPLYPELFGGGGGGGGGGGRNANYDAMNSWGPQGGGGGGFGVGRAAQDWQAVSGFIGTWYPRIHYAMMATNEVLATVVPALIAAGAGVAVGYQGGELAAGRYQALHAVQESLGGSLGQTAGGYVGLTNNLQKAQNQANTGVWELAGAAINSLKNNTGGFLQMGTNTIAMLDQFGAKLTLAFKGGAGGELQQLVGQGTNYLKQFGDVAGNIGLTFAHIAPNLPGVGGDILTTLQGATRGIANLTGVIPGPLLGAGLAAEAGARYGPTLVGGLGAGLGQLGKIPGLGFLGTAAHTATADEILASVKAGGSLGAGDLVGGTGIAGALGALGGPAIAGLAATAYLEGKLWTYKSPSQQFVSGVEDKVGQSLVGPQGAAATLAGLTQITGGEPAALSKAAGVDQAMAPLKGTRFAMGAQAAESYIGTSGVSAAYSAGAQQLAGQFNSMLHFGQMVHQQFGVSLPDAFSLTQQAMLQMGSAFGKNVPASLQQIQNLQAGYTAMHLTNGVFGKSVGEVNTALGLQNSQLTTVNSGWDQFTNNATAGAVGTATLAANLQTAAPTLATTAKALSGYGAGSSAAWSTFASASTTTPGLLQQSNSLADWIRTAQTSGALSGTQAAGMTAYLAKQLLPYGKDSKAALSAVGILGQEAGLNTTYDTGQSLAQNYKNISRAINGAAISQKGFNEGQTQAAISMSSVSKQASGFTQTMKSDVTNALAQGSLNLPKMSNDMEKFSASLKSGGTAYNQSALKSIFGDIKSGGGTLADAQAIVSQRMQSAGSSPQAIYNAMASSAKMWSSALGGIPSSKTIKLNVDAGNLPAIKAAIAAIPPGKNVTVDIHGTGAAAVQAAIDAVHGKNVTINVDEVYTVRGSGVYTPSAGLTPYTTAGAAANLLPAAYLQKHAAGYLVPGWGSGDTVPAMLEPGEAVVPKHLVASLAPFLKAHGVPGFASGGYVPYATYEKYLPEYNAYKAKMKSEHKWYDSFDQWYAGLHKAVKTGTGEALTNTQLLTDYAKNLGISPAAFGVTSSVASQTAALGHRVQASFNLARGVAGAALAGQGYGTQGLISGMDVTPGTGGGTLLEQMQSYLGSEKSFTGDLATLRKQHLSKALIAQMVAAGPVQGDALAQSVLNDYGGVKAVNATWNQIGQQSKGLGAQAAMAQYGGFMAPNLKSGTFNVGGIVINVDAPGGGTGNLPLTTAQINAIVKEIEAKLLQQARRNQRTGVQSRGKGA